MADDTTPMARQALTPFEETLASYRAATARVDEDDAQRAAAFTESAREREQRDTTLIAEASRPETRRPEPAATPDAAARNPRPPSSTVMSFRPEGLARTPTPPPAPPNPPQPAPPAPPPAESPVDRPERQRAVMSFRPPDVEPAQQSDQAAPRPARRADEDDDLSDRGWMR